MSVAPETDDRTAPVSVPPATDARTRAGVGAPPGVDPGATRVRRRRVAAGVLALSALLLGALLAGPPDAGAPLDPRSPGADGLRGLVEVAESLGIVIDVSTNLPADSSTNLLLARDRLVPEQHDRLEAWVRGGGRLVVADPTSPLLDLEPVNPPVSDLIGPSARTPGCALGALADVGDVRHADWTGFEVPDDGVGCFATSDDAAWLVARDLGEGTLIALGSPDPLVNHSLDRDDNAVLAAALLFPDRGTRVQVLPPDTGPGGGLGVDDPGLRDDVAIEQLLPRRVWVALSVALLAALVAVLALGRRLGPPVEERLPPTVRSAELAHSVGDLLQRAGSRDGAAARLRAHARDEVTRVLGAALAPQVLAEQVHHRLGVDLATARRALVDLEVADDDALVGVAAAAASVRDHLADAS